MVLIVMTMIMDFGVLFVWKEYLQVNNLGLMLNLVSNSNNNLTN
jgi:hypothetical protein